MTTDHYHIYCAIGQRFDLVVHEERHRTKQEAIKSITKLKRGYNVVHTKGGKVLYRENHRWQGQAVDGFVESREEFFAVYGQAHDEKCEQISQHPTLQREVMAWYKENY